MFGFGKKDKGAAVGAESPVKLAPAPEGMRRVHALHNIKHHPYYLDAGDVRVLPADIAALFIRYGWAQDAETGETGGEQTPQADGVTLDVQPIIAKTMSEVG